MLCNVYPDRILVQCEAQDSALLTKIVNFTAEKNIFSEKNLLFTYLSLGLHEGRPSYRRSLHPSKETIQHFKT
jgi:hypothetical protein